METIRPFRRDDIPQVAELYQRLIRAPRGDSASAPAGLEDAFGRLFFDCPCVDDEIPSLVAERVDGRILGFIGSHVRRMAFGGRPIRLACSGQFVTAPESRSRALGAFLLKRYLDGPQDVTITDGASDVVRRMWAGMGGETSLLASMKWSCVLRPFGYVGARMRERGWAAFATLLGPLFALCDLTASKVPPAPLTASAPDAPGKPLSPKMIEEAYPMIAATAALRPIYDKTYVDWLYRELSTVKAWGALHARAVTTEGELDGWYIYFLEPHGVGHIVQIAATEGAAVRVLDRLLADARGEGAVAIEGRIEPHLLPGLSHHRCLVRYGEPFALIHSRQPAILNAIHSGRAFLTRLEGEWWISLHREKYETAERRSVGACRLS